MHKSAKPSRQCFEAAKEAISTVCTIIRKMINQVKDTIYSNFSSVRRSPTMRSQQDFSRSFCSCCCPPLLSCSFLVPLGLLSHYLSTSLALVVFLCFVFPPLVRKALLPVVCFPPSLLRARTTSAFFF